MRLKPRVRLKPRRRAVCGMIGRVVRVLGCRARLEARGRMVGRVVRVLGRRSRLEARRRSVCIPGRGLRLKPWRRVVLHTRCCAVSVLRCRVSYKARGGVVCLSLWVTRIVPRMRREAVARVKGGSPARVRGEVRSRAIPVALPGALRRVLRARGPTGPIHGHRSA